MGLAVSEVWFYHLTEQRIEVVLPALIQKCLSRQWNVVVQTQSAEQTQALDTHLWTFSDASFLPHGCDRDGTESRQPVWLTNEQDNPNQAQIRFMLNGVVPPALTDYERGIYLFDGHDAQALDLARQRWKIEKQSGHTVTYWQQNTQGGWEKKA